MKNKVKSFAEEIYPELVETRREIHKNPELAFEEYKTANFVAEKLKSLGIEVKTGVAKTGIVGLLNGKNSGKVVALRADMDALPILEMNDVEYKSKNSGKMHACGHDAHIAMLLGSAKILSKFRDELNGTVKFIFQPSEEKNPGGAKIMIEDGVLENPKPDAIFALHVDPRIEVGKIGYCPGPTHAQPDEIFITIHGKGGHGAYPHLAIDPIVISAEVILALQTVASRFTNPLEPIVLTIGKISGGSATNVIPDKVELAGTLRTFNTELAEKVYKLMDDILKGITSSYGANYDLKIDKGYPVVYNDVELTHFAKDVAKNFIEEEGKVIETQKTMGGEDFGFYLQKIRGAILRLGVRNESKGFVNSLHSSTFNLDESALKIGSGYLASLAFEFLNVTI
jgi:amidohydrolase